MPSATATASSTIAPRPRSRSGSCTRTAWEGDCPMSEAAAREPVWLKDARSSLERDNRLGPHWWIVVEDGDGMRLGEVRRSWLEQMCASPAVAAPPMDATILNHASD